MSASQERRQYPRTEIKWPVVAMTPDGPKRGETKNISLGGALISCGHPLPLHERVCVVFQISEGRELVVNTIIARVNASDGAKDTTDHDVALYYVDLTSEEFELLEAEVAKKSGDTESDDDLQKVEEKKCPGCDQAVSMFKTCEDCGIVTCTGCLSPLPSGTVVCPECCGALSS